MAGLFTYRQPIEFGVSIICVRAIAELTSDGLTIALGVGADIGAGLLPSVLLST